MKTELEFEITEFNESLKWYRDNVDKGYANGFLNRLIRIKKLVEAIRSKGWISVKDGFPEKTGLCLVCFDTEIAGEGRIEIDLYKANEEFSLSRHNIHITHWQPLPTPPEKKG